MKISLTEMEEIHFYVIVNRKFRDFWFLRKLSHCHNFKVAVANSGSRYFLNSSNGSGSAAAFFVK